MHNPEMALIGLGANLGDPEAQLAEAVARIDRIVPVVAVSSVYRTAPVGFLHQPDFLNAVCVVEARLPPDQLLTAALRIEGEMGRVRGVANGPRRIDIDLLDVAGRPVQAPGLTLPHPRIPERAFVLAPIAEIAPEWRHPVLGRTARQLLAQAGTLERIERIGPLRWARSDLQRED